VGLTGVKRRGQDGGSSTEADISCCACCACCALAMAEEEAKEVHVLFRVAYGTQWGQNLVLCGPNARGEASRGEPMHCRHQGEELLWETSLLIDATTCFRYTYAVVEEEKDVPPKWEGDTRTLELPKGIRGGARVLVHDVWMDNALPENLLHRAAFTRVLNKSRIQQCGGQRPESVQAKDGCVVLRLKVRDWKLEAGETMWATGCPQALGEWNHSRALPMKESEKDAWEVELLVPRSDFPVAYKYFVCNAEGAATQLEDGPDRIASLEDATGTVDSLECVVHDDFHFRHKEHWRGAGVALPIFSLRTNNSVGAGEFLDLKKVVDLANVAGLKLIQILPINDTQVYKTFWDSYPYCSLSVFALHPLYLNLDRLSPDLPRRIKEKINKARVELDQKDMDYVETMRVKLGIAREVFDLNGQDVLRSSGFKTFLETNAAWLVPYACFSFLRDLFGTSEHWNWGIASKPTPQLLDRLSSPTADYHPMIAFMYYLQYNLHLQLLEASHYAQEKGVVLKGDLPIGVDKRSVDTWMYPELFRMNASTGAPPDYFDANGQNWGFPTYNWEEMEKDGYAWWRARLECMSRYFQAYRIDHILGFFRIWEIPANCKTGLLGRFRPCLPIWQGELEQCGIWDFDRLTKPYIKKHIVDELFGNRSGEVILKYLEEAGSGMFVLRNAFAEECQIVESLTPRRGSPKWLTEEMEEDLKGLLSLRQNVVLLKDPEDSRRFYPRIGMLNTSTFQELEPWQQDTLRRMYHEHFFEKQDDLWAKNAYKTLPALMDATDMLVCGEDLGMVPPCVPHVLHDLCLLGLRIQRMPDLPSQEFGDPSTYPYMTVCSPSCHDTTTLRGWWEEDEERRERFYRNFLEAKGDVPEECGPKIVREILRQHFDSPSCWAIFALQDLLALSSTFNQRPALEETINDPTNPKHYWRFRFHIKVEDMLDTKQWLADLQSLTVASGRAKFSDLSENLSECKSVDLYDPL